MGIVVCVAMLFGLLMFLPLPWRAQSKESVGSSWLSGGKHAYMRIFLAVAGLWNALWYGLQNLSSFWGLAALGSGLLMLAAAAVLSVQEEVAKQSMMSTVYRLLNPLRIPIFVGLLACFLLYLVTLIQLNLGMAIIR